LNPAELALSLRGVPHTGAAGISLCVREVVAQILEHMQYVVG
jgi:hypothetical protein